MFEVDEELPEVVADVGKEDEGPDTSASTSLRIVVAVGVLETTAGG